MTVIALTGGIAAGKTTVTDVLSSRGIRVVDADQLAREAVKPGSPGLTAIVGRFGEQLLTPDGELDRKLLGDLIFDDPVARADLNDIVHPEVGRLSRAAFATQHRDHPEQPLVYAVPLLAESGRGDEFDLVVLVDAPRATRLNRLVTSRGLSEDEATHRVDSQATDEQRRAIADVVIDSSGEISATIEGAEQLASALLELWPDRLDLVPSRLPSSPR